MSSRSDSEAYDVDRIRRDDKSLTEVSINDWESDAVLAILDALKTNTAVKKVTFNTACTVQMKQETLVKLSEVMTCNKSVESLSIHVERRLLFRERIFAVMATSGGWSSLQELVIDDTTYLSLRDAEHLSSFMIQSKNLRTLNLEVTGDETMPIIQTLARTKVQSLEICFHDPSRLQNGGRRIATALERCTCITDLRLSFPADNDHVEFYQLLLVGSIPKMVGLKKIELQMCTYFDQVMIDMVGQCIGGHQGEIEELRLIFYYTSRNSSSVIGLVPALRRLKVIRFHSDVGVLTLQQMGELSGVIGDCDSLEEFDCNFSMMSTKELKAICQLLSKFPSLKRMTQGDTDPVGVSVDLHRKSKFVPFLEMIKTSKTIEQVPPVQCRNAKKEAAIKHHCRNNMMHNQIEIIRKKGLLAATVPSSAWSLILKEFSDMSDVIYYLLQQKHGAMIGPARHGCKRRQDFD